MKNKFLKLVNWDTYFILITLVYIIWRAICRCVGFLMAQKIINFR